MARVLRALLASGLLVFAIALPAFANTINQTLPIKEADATQDCTNTTVADGMTTWHFVNNGAQASDAGSTLTATFENAGTQTATGFFQGGGTTVVMYNITIPSGDTLIAPVSDNITTTGNLVLSHVCVGGPPPEVPEAPIALLLPLIALLVVGGYLLINRRRSSVI
jgi:hypothetical protein